MSGTTALAEPSINTPARRDRASDFRATIESESMRAALAQLSHDRYDFERVFPRTSGWLAGFDVRRRVKLLASVEPLFGKLLLEGETVLYVTRGSCASLLEQYCFGALAYYMNRMVLVFTDCRILFLNVEARNRPLHILWHVPYDAIRKVGVASLSGALVLTLEDRLRLVFLGIPRRDRKPVKALALERRDSWLASANPMPRHAAREILCPACFGPVAPAALGCDGCRQAFVDPARTARLNLALPGLGDLAAGRRRIGALALVGYLALLALVVVPLAIAGAAPAAAPVLALAHGSSWLVTRHTLRKGVIPTKSRGGSTRSEVA